MFVSVWDLFVIVWGCVCYCGGLCLLLWGVVFVIVWDVFVIAWDCVCYYMGVVFVIVILVSLFKFNNVVWDKV